MEKFRAFLGALWQLLPGAGLASEYHPFVPGGAIPIPFIQSQKLLLDGDLVDRLASSPRLTKPARSFTSYMQGYSSLPLKDRALVALRSAHLCGARHLLPDIALCARDTGLNPSDIEFVARGHQAPGWNRHQRLLLVITDQLYENQEINRRHWRELQKVYDSQQALDLVLCIAAFHLCVYAN